MDIKSDFQYKLIWIYLSLYVFLALIFTYPLVFHLSDSIFGPPEDNISRVWNFFWIKKSLFELNQGIYHTDYIFYPKGINLYFNQFSLGNALVILPFQFFLNIFTCYNIAVILSFVLRGMSVFFLADYFIKNKHAAFVSGFIFAFCPFFIHKSLHLLDIASAQYIPFVLLFFFKMLNNPKPVYAMLMAFFMILTSLCSWVYMTFLVLLFVFIIIYCLIYENSKILNKKMIGYFLLSIILFTAFISFFAFPMLKEIIHGKTYMIIKENNFHYIDLLAFFVPADFHWSNLFLKDIFLRFYNHLPGDNWEINYYTGFTAIFLCVFGIIRVGWNKTKFWLLLAIVFFVLALGSTLYVNGADTKIPLPYLLINKTPLLNLSRIPGRYFALSVMGISVLAGFGFLALYNFINSKTQSSFIGNYGAFTFAACFLIGLEYFPRPNDLTPVNPPKYYQSIKKDASCKAVLEIPMWGYYSHFKDAKYIEFMKRKYVQTHYINIPNTYMLWQVYHEKKLLSGYVGRIYPEALDYYNSSPIRFLDEINIDSLKNNEVKNRIINEVKNLDIGYIVINEDIIKNIMHKDAQEKIKYIYNWLNKEYAGKYDDRNRMMFYKTNSD